MTVAMSDRFVSDTVHNNWLRGTIYAYNSSNLN